MTITSTSTLEEVEAQYDDNADYLEAGSVGKCASFMQATRMLLRRYATSMMRNSVRVDRDIPTLRMQLADAERWFQANGGMGTATRMGPTLVDFSRCRV